MSLMGLIKGFVGCGAVEGLFFAGLGEFRSEVLHKFPNRWGYPNPGSRFSFGFISFLSSHGGWPPVPTPREEFEYLHCNCKYSIRKIPTTGRKVY